MVSLKETFHLRTSYTSFTRTGLRFSLSIMTISLTKKPSCQGSLTVGSPNLLPCMRTYSRRMQSIFSIHTPISYPGVRPVAVLLQYIEGEGVGLYFAVSSLHLLRLAKIVEGLVCDQEHQYLLFASKL